MLARGYSMDIAMGHGAPSHSDLDMETIATSPGMQAVVFKHYTRYIFPSCLLIPFLAEPCVHYAVFMIKKWLVRSRPDLSVQQAETHLSAPPFDLARYGDILVNIMLCCGALAFTYRDLYILWIELFIGQVYIFCWDKFRFLRATFRNVFASEQLDKTAQLLCSAPCSIIAACLAFRYYSEGKSDALSLRIVAAIFNRDVIVVAMVVAASCHMLLHCLVVKYLEQWYVVEKDMATRDIDYAETAERIPCNWFNANPVHCLRSKYVFEHEVPITSYKPGREHLLEFKPEFGCYYHKSDILLYAEDIESVDDTWKAKAGEVIRAVSFSSEKQEAEKSGGRNCCSGFSSA